ncbi:PIN domain-like protein, partial [Mycena epipterygia]
RSLQKLTLSEGFEVNRHGIGALRVGIDGGGWLTETLPAIGSGENARLERLFYKLCQLLQVHTTVVFVFSGPNGPDFKRGEAVNKTPHPLTSQFQLLIQAFGFHCHTAPGDAEPELACLNRQGLIDVIFTHNPNIFILGATHIAYRQVFFVWNGTSTESSRSDEDNDFKNAHIFTADAVNQSAKLSTGGLLLIAILTGGDYALGLPGCDDTLAISLAQCGLGNSLLLAAQTLGPADLGFFLTVWCNTLKTTLISQGYPATAAQVTEAFPDPHILSLYVKPLTSWSFNGPGVDASDWRVNVPNLISIVRMCEDLFEWGTPAELPNKLFVVLLPGLCMKHLFRLQPRDELRLLQAHFEDRGDEAIPPLSSFIWINRPHGEVYQVEISTRTIATVITSSLRGTRHNRPTPVQPPKTIVHVGIPRSLLLHGLPAMVNRYE